MELAGRRQNPAVAVLPASLLAVLRAAATSDPLFAGVLTAGSLGLYVKTAAPTLYSLDAPEFTIAAATWGIPHASGYPLFVLLGHLFLALVPVGDLAYRMTLLTAILAALVPATLFLALRELRLRRASALIASAAFAVSYFQWSSAVVAKEHSLSNLGLALTLLLVLRWQRRGELRWLFLAGLAFGLGLSNHLSLALYAPALGVFVLTRRRLDARRALLVGLAVAAGLVPYAYLPLAYLAHPTFNIAGQYDAAGAFQPVNLASASGFLWMLTARQFGSLIFGLPPSQWLTSVAQVGAWAWGSYMGVGIIFGGIGARVFWKRNRPFCALCIGAGAAHLLFFATYNVPDRDSMFVPLYLLWAFPLAFGISAMRTTLPGRITRRALGLVLCCGVALMMTINYPLVDLSHDRRPRRWAEHFLTQLPPNTVVLARWVTAGPLEYLIDVEHQRPDVRVIDRFLMSPESMAGFVNLNAGHRPLAVDSTDVLPLDDLDADIVFTPLADPPDELLDRGGTQVFPGYLIVRDPA